MSKATVLVRSADGNKIQHCASLFTPDQTNSICGCYELKHAPTLGLVNLYPEPTIRNVYFSLLAFPGPYTRF